MSAETKRTGKATSKSTTAKPGSKKKPRRKKSATLADYRRLAVEYVLTDGNKTQSCINAGFSPHCRYYLFSLEVVRNMIDEIRNDPGFIKGVFAKVDQKAIDDFKLSRGFLDSNLAHIIVNGSTHFMRGDADRVKAIRLHWRIRSGFRRGMERCPRSRR